MTKLSVFVVNDSRLYTCRAFYPVSSLFQRHSQTDPSRTLILESNNETFVFPSIKVQLS